MKVPDLTKLCTPAQLYLFVELCLLVIMLVQNGNSDNTVCLGNYECYDAPNKGLMLLVKLGYVGFWTFVLNLICKAGYKNLSWFLVLLPVILFFVVLVLTLGPWSYNNSSVLIMEGMENPTCKDPTKLANAKEGAEYIKCEIEKLLLILIKTNTTNDEKCKKRIFKYLKYIKDGLNNSVDKVK